MTGLDNDLLALARAYGVATEFWDWRGNHVQVPEETIVAVLAAMVVLGPEARAQVSARARSPGGFAPPSVRNPAVRPAARGLHN